jgi:hypothetical protein
MTINADTFIRNLASAIVNKYPEMGNAILLDEIALDFLDPGILGNLLCMYSIFREVKINLTLEGNLCICVYRKSRSVFLPLSILHSSRASIMIMNSLEELYQFNFERIFKRTNTLFDELTPVFEVLCTLQKPIDEEQLMSISNIR